MPYPIISILIPTYSYLPGLEKILQSLDENSHGQVEVIIFDDSPDNMIEDVIYKTKRDLKFPIIYRHNRPPLGPGRNWNALLDAANGQYVLLIHHDEAPGDKEFAKCLVQLLNNNQSVDLFVMDCLIKE